MFTEKTREEILETARRLAAESKRILGEMTALRAGELSGLEERVWQLYRLFGSPKPQLNARLVPDEVIAEMKGMFAVLNVASIHLPVASTVMSRAQICVTV